MIPHLKQGDAEVEAEGAPNGTLEIRIDLIPGSLER